MNNEGIVERFCGDSRIA